jgi:hypothetical protein
MVNNSSSINKTNNHLFSSDGQQFHCFVDTCGFVDHHCLEVIVRFVDAGGIVDHHC